LQHVCKKEVNDGVALLLLLRLAGWQVMNERRCVMCADLYHALGNPQGEAESYRMHDSFSQMLLKDHFQSTQLSEHQLIQVPTSVLVTPPCWIFQTFSVTSHLC